MSAKHRQYSVIRAFTSLLPLICGCTASNVAPKTDETKKPVAVKTVAVVQEDVRKTSTQPASVLPYYRAEIRSMVSGYVKEVSVDIGDHVEAGTTLAIIDVPEMANQRKVLEAKLARFQSEEKRAEAGVQLAEANARSTEAMLAQAKSELSSVAASLAAMEAEFNRTNDLVQRRALESRMLDEVRKKRDSELARQEAMQAAVQSAEAEVAVAKSKTYAAQADVMTVKADTKIAQRQLEELDTLIAYTTLKAPFAGIVTARNVDPGNLVRKASEVGTGHPLLTISLVETVRVHIHVPEADAAVVGRGDEVTLSFPSFPSEEPIIAQVTRLAGELDPSTRTMLVEVELKNTDGKFIPGMFGQATISLTTKTAANMLPARAIRFTETGDAYVYIVGDDETVTLTQITTGTDNGSSIEVTSGLEVGQQVIDTHLKRFVTGDRVTLLTE